MRHRFKKFYKSTRTYVNVVVGTFTNKEKNCVTLVLPQLLFKNKYVYNISEFESARLSSKVTSIIEDYTKEYGLIHSEELPLAVSADNIIRSPYNISNIKWHNVTCALYINNHPVIKSDTIIMLCKNIIHDYKARHLLRQGAIYDKMNFKEYEVGGKQYNYFIKNDPDRIDFLKNGIQERINNTINQIDAYTLSIKDNKKELIKYLPRVKDKDFQLKYYLYLVNKKMNN